MATERDVLDASLALAEQAMKNALEAVAEAFEDEPGNVWTGGAVARLIREAAIRCEGKLTEQFGERDDG